MCVLETASEFGVIWCMPCHQTLQVWWVHDHTNSCFLLDKLAQTRFRPALRLPLGTRVPILLK